MKYLVAKEDNTPEELATFKLPVFAVSEQFKFIFFFRFLCSVLRTNFHEFGIEL